MHLSLKSSLGRQILTGIYVKDNRVLDLTTPFSELTFTLEDKSGEGNDATLYSGRYVSTDGVADKAINADCSAAGSALYYLTAWVRSSTTGTKWAQVSPTSSCYFTVATANVWQQLISTTILSEDVPSDVALGFADSTFPLTYSAANWSDVRLVNATTGATVARWQLNESADGDLNGYPALDSVGGYHGTHTGCAGGTGEGIDAEVAGAVFAANEDKMYFDGVNDYVGVAGMTASVSYFGACTISATIYVSDTTSNQTIWALGGGCYRLINLGGTWNVNASTSTGIPVTKGLQTVSVTYDSSGNATSFTIDGGDPDWTGSGVGLTSGTSFRIGARDAGGLGLFFKGLIYNFSITDSSVKNFAYAGTELVTWTDTTGGGNNGTVNGSPVTVGQKRATILQTAGMDWNKRMWFDGVDDYVEVTGMTAASNYFGACTISATLLVSDTTNAQAVFALGSAAYRLYISGGTWGLNASTDTGVAVTTGNHTVSVIFDASGLATSLTVDGSEVWTGSAAVGTAFTSFFIGTRSIGTAGLFFKGLIYDFAITGSSVKNFAFDGYGNTDDKWVDTVGSNNGTVNGSPSNFLIPASDTTPTNDALGNAIAEPRPTADTWNLFGDGEYGRVADADSLDVTTEATWEIWGNFYGVPAANQSFFTKYQVASSKRSWLFSKNASQPADKIVFNVSNDGNFPGLGVIDGAQDKIQCLSVTLSGGVYVAYLDAQVTTLTGAIDTTIFASDVPVIIGAQNDMPSDPNYASLKISRPKIYNRAFTADEVLKNYNAQKGAFGL